MLLADGNNICALSRMRGDAMELLRYQNDEIFCFEPTQALLAFFEAWLADTMKFLILSTNLHKPHPGEACTTGHFKSTPMGGTTFQNDRYMMLWGFYPPPVGQEPQYQRYILKN